MGVRGACRDDDAQCLRANDQREPGAVPREEDGSRWIVPPQCLRALRHAWQRLGMGARLLERQLRRRALRWLCMDDWRLQPPNDARWRLVLRSGEPQLGHPLRVREPKSHGHPRFPCRQDALVCLLGSYVWTAPDVGEPTLRWPPRLMST